MTVGSMAGIDYDFDPSKITIVLRDPRLKRVMVRDPERCATLNEYATSCSMDTDEVMEEISPYLDSGDFELDFYGDEVFLQTAPRGRGEGQQPVVAPNLWERLRERSGVDESFALWKLLRSLERAGWRVEHRVHRIMFGMGAVRDLPYLGVAVGHVVLPVLVFPTMASLQGEDGLLEQYEEAGANAVAVVCDERGLDDVITTARRWMLSRRVMPALSVLVLEAPRYNPTLLSPADAAVVPVALTRDTLGNYFW